MANPQAENGHVDIANEIVEALAKFNLSSYEWRVLMAIFRKTYGWKKKKDRISPKQFREITGIKDRANLHRAIKSLESKKIIVVYRDYNPHLRYGFQKDYSRWKMSSKKTTQSIQTTDVQSVPTTRSTKETRTKENIYLSDAKKIFEGYPRKIKKTQAIKNICSLLKKGISKETLFQATENYKLDIERRGTENEYIMYPSNFFGRSEGWRDYFNMEEAGDEKSLRDFREFQAEIRAKKKSGAGSNQEGEAP